MILKELSLESIEEIKILYCDVFTKEPWNDDWSDEKQLHQYITELIGNQSSLTYGLFKGEKMVGLCMGNIRHWYAGTEYYIDEFCIEPNEQGNGLGSFFLQEIEKCIKPKGIIHLFLQTERNLPAHHFYKKNGFWELEDHISLAKDIR